MHNTIIIISISSNNNNNLLKTMGLWKTEAWNHSQARLFIRAEPDENQPKFYTTFQEL